MNKLFTELLTEIKEIYKKFKQHKYYNECVNIFVGVIIGATFYHTIYKLNAAWQ